MPGSLDVISNSCNNTRLFFNYLETPMKPRLKESKKWTSVPEELCEQVLEVLKENFVQKSKIGKFFIEGQIYSSEVLIRIGYLENGRLVQTNAEVSIEYDYKTEKVQNILNLAFDCAGSMIENFFSKKKEEPPRQWMPFKVDKKQVHVQFSTVNSALEADADKLLGEGGSGSLVQGEDLDEEIAAAKSMIGISEDDDETKH